LFLIVASLYVLVWFGIKLSPRRMRVEGFSAKLKNPSFIRPPGSPGKLGILTYSICVRCYKAMYCVHTSIPIDHEWGFRVGIAFPIRIGKSLRRSLQAWTGNKRWYWGVPPIEASRSLPVAPGSVRSLCHLEFRGAPLLCRNL